MSLGGRLQLFSSVNETRREPGDSERVFDNNTKDSIRTVSLPRIKSREGLENVIIKNFNFRDEVVRGWRSRRNMPSIIQSRVDSKGLGEEFSFRERKDSCGAIWLINKKKIALLA